jgi:hypothetical protein
MKSRRSRGRALGGAVLLTALLAGCDFIKPVDVDPNAVPTATVDQLLIGATVNSYLQAEGQSSRVPAVWLQQMAGTDRQFSIIDQYIITNTNASGAYSDVYTGGGLVDIRQALALAQEQGFRAYGGIFKVYEAFLVGGAASIFGDVSYSEAVNPEISEPALDTQESVYAAVLALLDEAIADLASGEGPGPGGIDLVYGGDFDAWIAAAQSLKARLNLESGYSCGVGRLDCGPQPCRHRKRHLVPVPARSIQLHLRG